MRAPLRRHELAAGTVAAVLGGFHLLLLPPTGTDLAAQLARASFARAHPLAPVDFSWYGGTHVFGYSLLAPYVLAAVGVALAGLIAAVGASLLFARLLRETARPMAGSILGAVFAVANTVSGRTTFALGAVAGLAALVLLPRLRWAAGFAVLTALLSPVAAVFLGLAGAVLLLRREHGGLTLGIAAAAPVALVALLFPAGGVQPYEPVSALYAVAAGLTLAVLTALPSVRIGAVLYAVAAGALVLVDNPFGSNILRLGLLLAGPLVLATATIRTTVLAPVVLALGYWQVQPTYADLRADRPPPFEALTQALVELGVQRVEVVPLRDHGEAAYVAPQVQLARGWSRQIDTARNPLFYEGALTADRYSRWLRANSVQAVALASKARADMAGQAERDLLQDGAPTGLRKVWSDANWTVWLVEPRPALASPPLGQVFAADRSSLRVRGSAAGSTRLALRWSRWLSVRGPACLEQDGHLTRLRFTAAGEVTVTSSLRPRGHCPD